MVIAPKWFLLFESIQVFGDHLKIFAHLHAIQLFVVFVEVSVGDPR